MLFTVVFRFCLLCLLLLHWGCVTEDNPQVLQYRERFLLSEKPEGAISIEQARETLQENEDIILSLRVGSRDVPQWWTNNKATMVVSEGLPGSHYNLSNGHDPETCPFCRWKWKVENATALVEFRDQQGVIIPLDCRSLLDVRENDQLLVSGKATLNGEGFLELTAEGVYLTPSRD